MLTPKERARIRMTENYRQKFAGSPKVSSNRSAIFAFLNTNLGLFMLSSVFITLFSWGYNNWSEIQKAKVKKAETEKHLRIEIAYRLRIIHKLTRRFPDSDLNIIRTATYGFRVGTMQLPTHMLLYSPVFDEYGSRSLESLFWELESSVNDSEKAAISNARIKCFDISEYYDRLNIIKQAAPQARDESGYVYFYELPDSDKQNLENNVFKYLTAFEQGA